MNHQKMLVDSSRHNNTRIPLPRERNADKANLQFEVRSPGNGFRAKLSREVSVQERTVRGLSRSAQQTTDMLNLKSLHQRKHHLTGKNNQQSEEVNAPNMYALIRQSKTKMKSIKNPKNLKIILSLYRNGICRLSSENILIFYTFSSCW